jgi:hypothetical protein
VDKSLESTNNKVLYISLSLLKAKLSGEIEDDLQVEPLNVHIFQGLQFVWKG